MLHALKHILRDSKRHSQRSFTSGTSSTASYAPCSRSMITSSTWTSSSPSTRTLVFPGCMTLAVVGTRLHPKRCSRKQDMHRRLFPPK